MAFEFLTHYHHAPRGDRCAWCASTLSTWRAVAPHRSSVAIAVFGLCTHHLTTAEFGVPDLVVAFGPHCGAVSNLGMESNAAVFCYCSQAGERVHVVW